MKNPFNAKKWKAYYINLDHRTDRRENIEVELRKVNVVAERMPGKTDTDILNFKEIKLTSVTTGAIHSTDKNLKANHHAGNWGCTLSHYSILKKHLESKDERILAVFEDDAYFAEDFNERLEYLNKNFDLEWDMFFLGSWCCLLFDEKTSVKYVWRIRDVVYGGHGYLINPKSLSKIIELVKEKAKETEIIDSIYCHLVPHLKIYAIIPGVVSQIKSKSDIACSIGDYPSQFGKIYGEHIFANRLEDFKYYKTKKVFLFKYYFKNMIIIHMGKCGVFLKIKYPKVYKFLKPYFPDKK